MSSTSSATPRSSVIGTWVCVLTRPGITIRPVVSIVLAASKRPPSSRAPPTATIRSPRTATAASGSTRKPASIVTTVPPESRRSTASAAAAGRGETKARMAADGSRKARALGLMAAILPARGRGRDACGASATVLEGGSDAGRAGDCGTRAAPERLFYDGSCALCHWAVRFVLARDREGRAFRFAPLDSDAFRKAAPQAVRTAIPDSLVVETRDGRLLTRSSAVIHILGRLGTPWRGLGAVAGVLPRALLDALYDFVARVRYRVFGREPDACPVIPKDLRSRFDL
jgi:predicted DCC family thiol-disulfide oxidoreductase YuxK